MLRLGASGKDTNQSTNRIPQLPLVTFVKQWVWDPILDDDEDDEEESIMREKQGQRTKEKKKREEREFGENEN